ncbi:MAG: integration host factor subunit beta [Thiotrichales bacterium]|nr:integration host factor subunit beta [Thiotrichales bacterium]MBT3854429.1 integration host factor subunit beta [Thiotrichales bacterium]MBT4653561.1 integration host factor subunit beta [Thiotrichales bacterium]MBT5499484.1 integration host factor subunit beta [Thiotrichales bacterium]MBT7149885.1 integration host factor subunit beta [Thiotrichales bacterium]
MAASIFMKKIDLIEAVSKEIKITRSEAKQSVEIILEEISSAIVSGKGVEVRGFGGFQKRHRKSRLGINPKTGQKTEVAEKFVPFFKPGKLLKEAVNKG